MGSAGTVTAAGLGSAKSEVPVDKKEGPQGLRAFALEKGVQAPAGGRLRSCASRSGTTHAARLADLR